MAKTKKKVAPKKKATTKETVVNNSKTTVEVTVGNTIQYVPHKPRKIDRVPPPINK
jgi:hypothetical protein|tara:strand:- start:283 stop:450 length:168 start_codon:yes stop_codon:yes gene_type:complete